VEINTDLISQEIDNAYLSIIIPIYNEVENINLLHQKLNEVLIPLSNSYEVILINDGSKDGSKELLDQVAQKDKNIKVIHFIRNYGQTTAMMAGIDYANQKYGKGVILVGSSYSAALALKIAAQNDKVKAVASFSPGEYYKEKGKTFISDAMAGLTKPIFLTSSKNEAPQAGMFYKIAQSEIKIHYIPEVQGIHGARALWDSTEGTQGYWEAFKNFLNQVK